MRAERGPEAVHAARVHEVAFLARDQHGQEGARPEVDAVPAHREGLLPLLARGFNQAAAAPDSCVVEDEIHVIRLVRVGDGRPEGEQIGLAGDVGHEAVHTGSARSGFAGQHLRLLHVLAGDVAHRDVTALRRELPHELAAHARPAARHDRNLPREALHAFLLARRHPSGIGSGARPGSIPHRRRAAPVEIRRGPMLSVAAIRKPSRKVAPIFLMLRLSFAYTESRR